MILQKGLEDHFYQRWTLIYYSQKGRLPIDANELL